MDRLPELVLQQIFQQVIDFRSLEYFEDPDFLGTWGQWAEEVLPLLAVCRYWRAISSPMYYQYAAICYINRPYNTIRPACRKARLNQITSFHLQQMVKHVYMQVYLSEVLANGLEQLFQDVSVSFNNVTQLTMVLDESEGSNAVCKQVPELAYKQRRTVDLGLSSDAVCKINWTCHKLQQMFPHTVAVNVTGTSRSSIAMTIVKICCEMVQNKQAVWMEPRSYMDMAAAMVNISALRWIKVDSAHRCMEAVELVRRNHKTLTNIIFTNTWAHFASKILHGKEWLAYPQLRGLKLGLRRSEQVAHEIMPYGAFPRLSLVVSTPEDPRMSSVLFQSMNELTCMRLFLCGSSVRQLCRSGMLDACEFPALRHLHLYRPVYNSDSEASDNGPQSMDSRDLLQLVSWALSVGRLCSSIVLSGWRIGLGWAAHASEISGLLSLIHGNLRWLELPCLCTIPEAQHIASRFPYLTKFGILLAQPSVFTPDQISKTSNLKELCVAISCAIDERSRDTEQACLLASQLPSLKKLVYHADYGDTPLQLLNTNVFELDLANDISAMLESERFRGIPHLDSLEIQCRGPDPHWL
ncbi:hypothetical protein H4R22_001289 [Coemansia sp. RSA 1290]|nr:hypothetical protein H4R22_001289 [Coemansia sp. RSA 1290]KAJ2648541.1 hypothetical protein IWW40_003846 [Coemansia sp. RSA 1250]